VFPDWNTIFAVYDANLQLAIWGVYVQGLYGKHFDHLLYLIDIPAHHVCGSVYSGVPPDLFTPISNPSYSQDSLSRCLDNLSGRQGTDEQMMASSPSFGCRITSSSAETSTQPGSSQYNKIPIRKK